MPRLGREGTAEDSKGYFDFGVSNPAERPKIAARGLVWAMFRTTVGVGFEPVNGP
jgi:hypothetical protein